MRRHDYVVLPFVYRSETPTIFPRHPTYRSTTILLELPVPVVERTHLACLQPSGNAMEVESVITYAPGDCALLTRSRGLIGLALDA